MIISSRTPEGQPNVCPLCAADVVLEPSLPFGDAPCPACGQLLWFLTTDGETRLFEAQPGESLNDRIARVVSAQLGVPAEELCQKFGNSELDFIEELAMDSIDIVELVMCLDDDEFDSN